MNEEITAFQFDDALSEASGATDDSTAREVALALWFHYDDCKDHKIVASKEVWDYFNRLLLLLESDGEMETTKSWREWHACQAVAALLFLCFTAIAIRVGIGAHLFVYALPFGPPSMLLAWLNSRRRRKAVSPKGGALTPFPSFGSLLAVRRRIGGFVRRRYPETIVGRRVRDPIIEKLIWVPWSITWCIFSPVALILQMLPERDIDTRIKMPELGNPPDRVRPAASPPPDPTN